MFDARTKDRCTKPQDHASQIYHPRSRFQTPPLYSETEELDEERDKYYKLKRSEMNEFVQNVERFRSENRVQVESLRRRVKELSSTFDQIHEKNNYLRNTS
ncbi:uncharacterized protein LOC106432787 [Brassica napus]|uniref:uncharacterized protein LOC106432787 n=1 Tax=Brassica napus TaxID=3708 RepID=UPI000BBE23EF|nr:uncharacterized protein LOC106432787 [Brassica napus]